MNRHPVRQDLFPELPVKERNVLVLVPASNCAGKHFEEPGGKVVLKYDRDPHGLHFSGAELAQRTVRSLAGDLLCGHQPVRIARAGIGAAGLHGAVLLPDEPEREGICGCGVPAAEAMGIAHNPHTVAVAVVGAMGSPEPRIHGQRKLLGFRKKLDGRLGIRLRRMAEIKIPDFRGRHQHVIVRKDRIRIAAGMPRY